MPYADPEKQKAYDKAWYWANREEDRARSKEYRAKNKEQLSAKASAHYAEHRDERLAKQKDYAAANAEQISKYQAQYQIENKEKLDAQHKEYRVKNNAEIRAKDNEYKKKNRALLKEKQKIYSKENRKGINARKLAAYHVQKNDPGFRIQQNLRTRIWKVLRGLNKSAKTMTLLGCTIEFLREHLEKQFQPGMTWENYGPVWHVDHILPCAEFHLQHSEEQEVCFHWTNLQPLFAADNLSKSDKII